MKYQKLRELRTEPSQSYAGVTSLIVYSFCIGRGIEISREVKQTYYYKQKL